MTKNKKIAIIYGAVAVLMFVMALISIFKSQGTFFAVFIGLTFVWTSLASIYYSEDGKK